MNRRGFLSSCLAFAAAPAIVRADSLMRIVPKHAGILVPSTAAIADPFAGVFRLSAFDDCYRMATIYRLDTLNTVEQFHVDFMVPIGEQLDEKLHLAPAREVLVRNIEHYHGSLDGFRAPPKLGWQ